MKKNVTLFLILIGLLTFTYFFQEIGFWNPKPKSLAKNLALTEIDSLSFKDGNINLKPSAIIEDLNFPADGGALARYLTALSYVAVKKEMKYDSQSFKNYFSPDAKRLRIRKANLLEIELILGEKVPGEEAFYWLEKKGDETKLYIANYEEAMNSGESKYMSDGEKYQHIEQLLDISSTIFFQPELFSKSEMNSIVSLSYQDGEISAFTVPWNTKGNFDSVHGLVWNHDKIKMCKDQLLGLKGQAIKNRIDSADLLANLEFKFSSGVTRKLKLFHEEKGEGGFYIEREGTSLWFQLPLGQEGCFLMTEQDYWKKSLPLQTSQPLILLSKGKKLELSEKAKESGPLFNLLFSKSPFNEADRLSFTQKKEPLLLQPGLNIEWGALKLFLTQKKDEILLMNKKDGYILHYYLTPERKKLNMSFEEKDYKP
ncbi:MAG: hypothetical protein ACOYL6_10525 [Bacteriovoracaceae bacterium]